MGTNRRVLALIRKRPIATLFSLLMGVAVAGSYYSFAVRPWQLFWAEKREMRTVLESLMREPPPAGVSPDAWEDAWMITDAGLDNVCLSLYHVSLDDMRRLHRDIVEHAATFRSFDFMCWLWRRLAETGPTGTRSIKHLTALFEDIGKRLDASGDGKRHGFQIGEIRGGDEETIPIIGEGTGVMCYVALLLAWGAAALVAVAATGLVRGMSKIFVYVLVLAVRYAHVFSAARFTPAAFRSSRFGARLPGSSPQRLSEF